VGTNGISTLKINFEVLYLTQISIFLEENKIIGSRLFITTLQPLELSFLITQLNSQQFNVFNQPLFFLFTIFFKHEYEKN